MGKSIIGVKIIILATFLLSTAGCPTVRDYDQYFHSVTPSTYDIDGDGYDDTVSLDIDADTTGSDVVVTVYAELYNPAGYWVDQDTAIWTIYGTAIEYGYVYLTATSGNPGYYDYYLELYDDLGYYEDSWWGSVYLSP